MENAGLFTNVQEKHITQVTGNNSSCTDYQCKQTTIRRLSHFSTFIFSNTNSQKVTCNDNNCTFNSAQLTSFLSRTADETLKSFPMDPRYYRSASNSLLARTADRTPKTFALPGDQHPSDIQALYLYTLPRQVVTSQGII
ncbi:hypothetical protein AVEN_204072-1 [Araneus ventricosus]|uniref:Uncharacterized protein n=1 Tax=Araneus ventricosus TaxID=182803 RepID=A0A4Y2L1I2_ARAVE|nr:hypothetical protein AVEN_204072-1 [Araneus ventricosus]